MSTKKIFALFILTFLITACSYNNERFVIETIGNALGKEIDEEKLILISYPQQDIAIYQDERIIYLYVLRDKRTVVAGMVGLEHISHHFVTENESIIWFSSSGEKSENLYVLWGIVPNTKKGCITLMGEPLHPNYIELENVSLFYKFFEQPLELPILIENRMVE